MKQKLTDWLTIILTAAVGVLFIMWHGEDSLFQWLVRALGVILVIPALYETYIAVRGLQGKLPHKPESMKAVEDDAADAVAELTFGRRAAFTSMLIVSAAAIIAGLWMIIDPATFIGLLAYLLAAVLVLLGVCQLVSMYSVSRTTHLPWYFYIVPSAFVIVGIVILLMSPDKIIATVAMLTGILLLISAINSAMQMAAVSAINGQRRRDAAAAEAEEAKEPKQIPENVD